MEILIITGPPYSGKGTQCELLKILLGFTHISTGDRIRKEKEEKSPIGKIVMEYEESGALVPDEIMQDLIGLIIDENLHAFYPNWEGTLQERSYVLEHNMLKYVVTHTTNGGAITAVVIWKRK